MNRISQLSTLLRVLLKPQHSHIFPTHIREAMKVVFDWLLSTYPMLKTPEEE